MGKKLKKNTQGEAVKYISRTQAIRKLQVTLPQFRRLCILKGIYPVEPKNKKVKKKSTLLQTFYYKKDIQYLLHEPILSTMREEQIYKRKLGKALHKNELKQVEVLRDNRPIFKLDHLVKERYPSFEDALRDLDDCLSMVALFSNLTSEVVSEQKFIADSLRLYLEFQHFVIKEAALKKVFLSIKGIYYQVEIHGVEINWIAPYQFTTETPHDVDFRVMNTFLEFNQTLLGFVNYKLFSELSLIYPPRIDDKLLEDGASLASFVIESTETETKTTVVPGKKMSSKKLQAIVDKSLSKIKVEEDDEPAEEEDAPEAEEEDEFTVKAPESGNGQLFAGHVFWISREVPLYLMQFVILACGGKLGWERQAGAGSPFEIDDPRITIQITDRPSPDMSRPREYLQPQWLYDCINQGKLLKTANYHPGETLPPHLSPFVQPGEEDYSPMEQLTEEPAAVEETSEVEEDVEAIEKAEEQAADQDKELAKIMMSKRDRKLYDKIQFGKERKKQAAEKLRQKRRAIQKK